MSRLVSYPPLTSVLGDSALGQMLPIHILLSLLLYFALFTSVCIVYIPMKPVV